MHNDAQNLKSIAAKVFFLLFQKLQIYLQKEPFFKKKEKGPLCFLKVLERENTIIVRIALG